MPDLRTDIQTVRCILIPAVSVLCVVGSYAIHKNFLDVVIMMIFGVLGYLLRKFDLNNAAVVLALILGPIGEKGLRRSLALSKGSPAILFSTPVLLGADRPLHLRSFCPRSS